MIIITSSNYKCTTVFDFCACSREIIDISRCDRKIFQNLKDDLVFVSRSSVYQKYKVQIVLFRVFDSSCMLYGC